MRPPIPRPRRLFQQGRREHFVILDQDPAAAWSAAMQPCPRLDRQETHPRGRAGDAFGLRSAIRQDQIVGGAIEGLIVAWR